MTVDELLHKLAYGELTNLSLAKGGSIIEEKIPTIILHANDGLLRLYSEFILSEKEVLIEQVAHITNYHLRPAFSESSGDSKRERYLYIKDRVGEPFLGDVIKVLAVYADGIGALPLNDPDRVHSVNTPQSTILQVPYPRDGQAMSVVYQASHPKLDVDDLGAHIELPDVLHKALTAYIASKVFSDMNGQDNMAKGQEQYSVYQSVCMSAVDKDLVNTSLSSTNLTFHSKGWI